MTDKSYIKWHSMSDTAIEIEIGRFIKHMRQQKGKTQQQLADASNISRSTLSLLERGDSGNLKTLIQVLRVLDQLQILQAFEYKTPISPLALAKAQYKPRKRIKPSKQKKVSNPKRKSDW